MGSLPIVRVRGLRGGIVNLYDVKVPSFPLDRKILSPSLTPSALHLGVQAYRYRGLRDTEQATRFASRYMTKHERSMYADSVAQLERTDILNEEGKTQEIPLGKARVYIPSELNYSQWNSGELRVYIALYQMVKGSHWHPFKLTEKLEEIAKVAGCSISSVQSALASLSRRKLIRYSTVWRKGTHIALLDPYNAEWDLSSLGEFYKNHMDNVPVVDRYRECLRVWDPRRRLHEPCTGLAITVVCPFCKGQEPSFRFDCREDRDEWTCHNCGKKGSSAYLWMKLKWNEDRDKWKSMLREARLETQEEMQ